MGVIIRFTIFSVLLLNTIMLNLGISLMVQYLGFCLPMRGHWFDPWSGKIPHATGQLNPCYTTPEASTLEPTLSNKRSHHTEKPKHCKFLIFAHFLPPSKVFLKVCSVKYGSMEGLKVMVGRASGTEWVSPTLALENGVISPASKD